MKKNIDGAAFSCIQIEKQTKQNKKQWMFEEIPQMPGAMLKRCC